MPKCACGFGHSRSAFGKSADSFFGNLNKNGVESCLSTVYNNVTPLTHSSGFGQVKSRGPMKIGKKR
jgi:hypothetical protein